RSNLLPNFKRVYRFDACPPPVLDQIRDRYRNVRKSELPLIEATKQIVFIDVLIGLLSEEGFDFRQGLDGNHLLVDRIHKRKIFVKVVDEDEEKIGDTEMHGAEEKIGDTEIDDAEKNL
ncbi:199_t:CDS:1, partial [Acaulospora morrowiae]